MTNKRATKKAPAEVGAGGMVESDAEAARIKAIVSEHWASQIEEKRPAIEGGDGNALLGSIMDVVMSGDPFPEWLSFKVARAIRAYQHHETLTLDDAFHVKRPDGYRRKAAEDRWNHAWPVVRDIRHLHAAGVPVGDALFEVVGERHGIGKTTASKWFYFHKKNNTVTYCHSFRSGIPLPVELEELRNSLIGGR